MVIGTFSRGIGYDIKVDGTGEGTRTCGVSACRRENSLDVGHYVFFVVEGNKVESRVLFTSNNT